MKILVTGATGRQGGAVVDHLLSGEFGHHEVYGLTRDLTTDRARALVERGVHVVEGDVTDGDRMRALLEGVEGVFCVTTDSDGDPGRETAGGVTLADAAAEAGVRHVVYASVVGADRSPLPRFRATFAVEERLRELGVPTTVLRAGYFVQHFDWRHREVEGGSLALPLSPGTVLPLVDVDDVGRAAAAAFADPGRFVGETLELVGDAPTVAEIAAAFADALGRPVEAVTVPLDRYRADHGDDAADTYAWVDDGAFDARRPDLSRFGLELRTLAQSLARSDVWRSTAAPRDNLQ